LMEDGRLDLAIDLDGRRIGEIQTYVPPGRRLDPGEFEVGIALEEGFRGLGYGTEATALLLDWLFEAQHARRVHMPTVESNTAMRTVLERLGFESERVVRELGQEFLFYGTTRARWLARREAPSKR